MQEMQEQMTSMNDSGEFQEVNSNYSGRLSCVSSQPAMIPSSRSLPSRDRRLPLDTWNQSRSTGERFLEIIFLRLIHVEIILKEFSLAHHKENEGQFHKKQDRKLCSQEMTNTLETQFQCRHLQEGRTTVGGRSMLSCDKRLPLDTWNVSGPQEDVFCNQFSTFGSSRNLSQGIHHSTTPGATGPVTVHIGAGTLVARATTGSGSKKWRWLIHLRN